MEPFDSGNKQSVYFIVKNISSINRVIKIFNTKISPQQQLDLMMIPGITEEDIRASLLKGQLKQLLNNQTIQIIKSTIAIGLSDSTFSSYLTANGINTSLLGTNPTFVFRPGGTQSGNVYTSWSALMTAIGGISGPKWIEIDSSISAAHMTTGNWNLNLCTLVAAQGAQQFIIDNGATIDPNTVTLTLDGALFIQNNSTQNVWTTSKSGAFYLLVMRGFSEIACSAGAAAFLRGTSGTAGIQISMIESAVLGDYTHNVVTADSGVTIYILETDISSIYPHSLAGAGTIQVTLAADSTVDTPQDVTTLTLQYSSGAARVNYVPASNANWSNNPPATIAAALDRIAAKIGPIS